MIAFSLSDSEKYFSWASLHFFFATSHSLLRDSNSLLWVRLVEFCTKKKYNTIVSVNYVQKWYFSSFWQTQHDSCTYRDIGKLKTQDVFERGPTSTENEVLCLLICLDATICALQSVLPRRPLLHESGQMFQRKNFLHAQISLHGTVQILLQIAMLFAVQKFAWTRDV